MSSVTFLANSYFQTLSHNDTIFFKDIQYKLRFEVFTTNCSKNLFWEELKETSQMYKGLHVQYQTSTQIYKVVCTVPFILIIFRLKLNFLKRFSKNNPVWNFKRICPVGSEIFPRLQTDRHSNMRKLTGVFISKIYERANYTHTKSNILHNAIILYIRLFSIFCPFSV
jgi:hypothetical protein